MTSNLPTFLNGLVVGVILFQTAVIAPTVFRSLGPDQAGPFLRKVFPKFFVVLVVMGTAGAISALASDASYQLWICLVTLTLGLLAYLLIPMTNKSRDEVNEKLFKKLHNASVLMTVLILVVNLFGLAL
ncbi:MAG: DUF4149 domain-containing protein [Porticoccaceae bacterium]|nr:DUF4149 domain-containing protein [Porticoccaceae bacterium]